MSLLLLLVMSGCSAKGIGDKPTPVLASPTLTETPAPIVTPATPSPKPIVPTNTPFPNGTTAVVSPSSVATNPSATTDTDVPTEVNDAAMEELLKKVYILPVNSYFSDSTLKKLPENGDIMLEVFRRMGEDPNYIPDLNKMFPTGKGIFIAWMQNSRDNKIDVKNRVIPNLSQEFSKWLRENKMALFTKGFDLKNIAHPKTAISILGVDIPDRSDVCIQQTWEGGSGVWIILIKSDYGNDLAQLPPSFQSYLIHFLYNNVHSKNYSEWLTWIAKYEGGVMKCFLAGK
jgi:hypothetical protein